MNRRQRIEFYKFGWRQSRGTLAFVLLGMGAVLAVLWRSGWEADWWGNWLEPLVGLLTLSVALLVWRQQMREEWVEEHLPKKLTVSFRYKGREVMRCEQASLISSADIRPFSQQIGSQMNGNVFLKFDAPEIRVEGPALSEDGDYSHYSATFFLMELPAAISSLQDDEVWVWRRPFIDEHGKPTFQAEKAE